MRVTWSLLLLMVCFVPIREGIECGGTCIIVHANVNQTHPSGSGSSCSIIYSYEYNTIHYSNVPLIIKTGCDSGYSRLLLVNRGISGKVEPQ
jgi:hypothetical protein